MPFVRGNKKDNVKQKRNLEFTQDLLANEHQPSQVELRRNNLGDSNTTAYNPIGVNSPNNQAVANRIQGGHHPANSDESHAVVFEKHEGYKWDLCIVVPNPYFVPPPKDENAEEEKPKSKGCCSCFGKKEEEDDDSNKLKPNVSYQEIIERLVAISP